MDKKHLNHEKGKETQEKAKQFLLDKGYTLKYENLQFSHLEVDLIMMHQDTVVFVEVKFRARYGDIKEIITMQKQNNLIQASQLYKMRYNYEGEIRFDVVFLYYQDEELIIEHYEDAFY
ncbi:MAG: YraN family protein [Chitinophagales bacterium]|jgi:putative endonuclease|nr:YraN family protein [Chitinophagales bacterium]